MCVGENFKSACPNEKEQAKSKPSAVSSLIRELLEMICVPNATKAAATIAPANNVAGAAPNNMRAIASPGSNECEIASAIKESRRITMKTLKMPLVKPINTAPKSAR